MSVIVVLLAVIASLAALALVKPFEIAVFVSIVPILVGGITANRLGYRHQGEATARAMRNVGPTPPSAREAVAEKIGWRRPS